MHEALKQDAERPQPTGRRGCAAVYGRDRTETDFQASIYVPSSDRTRWGSKRWKGTSGTTLCETTTRNRKESC